jgi:hypothetical protein
MPITLDTAGLLKYKALKSGAIPSSGKKFYTQ